MARKTLVVGAAGGVGLELVKQLISRGDQVIATVLDEDEASRLKIEAPRIAKSFLLNLADANGIANEIWQHVPELDALVVCAAVAPYGPLETASLDVLRRTLEINAVSNVAVYQACLPLLRESKGRMIFISSFAGKVGLPFLGHYVASKFALEGLGDVMRREARAWGVDVILIEPGAIRTSMVTAQLAGIERDRAALSELEFALYGGLYDSFAAMAAQGWETGLDPASVAESVLAALDTPQPSARYQVGEDSKYLCDSVAKQSDAEMDAIVSKMLTI